jgi:hypothetical protein
MEEGGLRCGVRKARSGDMIFLVMLQKCPPQKAAAKEARPKASVACPAREKQVPGFADSARDDKFGGKTRRSKEHRPECLRY